MLKTVHINRGFYSFMHIIYTLFPVFASQIFQEDIKKNNVSKSELSDETYKQYRIMASYLEIDMM